MTNTLVLYSCHGKVFLVSRGQCKLDHTLQSNYCNIIIFIVLNSKYIFPRHIAVTTTFSAAHISTLSLK